LDDPLLQRSNKLLDESRVGAFAHSRRQLAVKIIPSRPICFDQQGSCVALMRSRCAKARCPTRAALDHLARLRRRAALRRV
jgi:hypothetical protein